MKPQQCLFAAKVSMGLSVAPALEGLQTPALGMASAWMESVGMGLVYVKKTSGDPDVSCVPAMRNTDPTVIKNVLVFMENVTIAQRAVVLVKKARASLNTLVNSVRGTQVHVVLESSFAMHMPPVTTAVEQ